MKPFGTPYSDHAVRVLLLGSGELGKEVAIELQRYAVRYEMSQGENEALSKLRLGRLQAVVLEKRQIERMNMIPEELRCEPGGVIAVQPVMLRIHPQYRQWLPALNRAIAQLQANGKLKTIFQKPRG